MTSCGNHSGPQAYCDEWDKLGIDEFEPIRKAKGRWDLEVSKATEAGLPMPTPTLFSILAQKAYAYPDVQKHQALVQTLANDLHLERGYYFDPEPAPSLARPSSRMRRL